MSEKDYILQVKDLHVHYVTDEADVSAVNGISFDLEKGDTLGLVGETGAGKTTTALSIMQLIPSPPGVVEAGEIIFNGKDLLLNSEKENQAMRGNSIAMIFQDPMTALNPTMTVGKQLVEVIRSHNKVSRQEAEKTAKDMLEVVGVQADRFNDYPHQFSGGMKQRVVITMALLCHPELLIADEPTTALDVTIQAQVLEVIRSLQKKYGMSMILITHDLGVVAETCNKVAVVYAGQIVESGSVQDVFLSPKHPYTKGLFDSIPRIDGDDDKLIPIDGITPNMANLPDGCYFHPRCKYCKEICKTTTPQLTGEGHNVRCHFPLQESEVQ
jgi:oligopeptide/dipeptide ABC transporter ATP-binding protein